MALQLRSQTRALSNAYITSHGLVWFLIQPRHQEREKYRSDYSHMLSQIPCSGMIIILHYYAQIKVHKNSKIGEFRPRDSKREGLGSQVSPRGSYFYFLKARRANRLSRASWILVDIVVIFVPLEISSSSLLPPSFSGTTCGAGIDLTLHH